MHPAQTVIPIEGHGTAHTDTQIYLLYANRAIKVGVYFSIHKRYLLIQYAFLQSESLLCTAKTDLQQISFFSNAEKLQVWKTLSHFLSRCWMSWVKSSPLRNYWRKRASQDTGQQSRVRKNWGEDQVVDRDRFSWGLGWPQVFWWKVVSSNIY